MSEEILTIEHFRLPLENGLELEGEVRVPAGTAPKPVILISHGFRGIRTGRSGRRRPAGLRRAGSTP